MIIYIKTLTGRCIEIEIESGDTVENIKNKITDKEGIPADQQVLILSGVKLENAKTLHDYHALQLRESTLFLVIMLRGGER